VLGTLPGPSTPLSPPFTRFFSLSDFCPKSVVHIEFQTPIQTHNLYIKLTQDFPSSSTNFPTRSPISPTPILYSQFPSSTHPLLFTNLSFPKKSIPLQTRSLSPRTIPFSFLMNVPFPYIPRPGGHREKFFPDEDTKLKELVLVHGETSWSTIASHMPGRNARQCRERWKHYLSSDKGKIAWTSDEDQLLYQKMVDLGPRWTAISQYFPGRTDMQVKSRWMQRFAPFSDLHLKNRQIHIPLPAPPVRLAQAPGVPGVILVQASVPAFQFATLPFPRM
jgi:hypothetical protein